MISKFFYGTGWAIIILGAISSFLAFGGILAETTLPGILAIFPLIYSIFGAMFFFAIGKVLEYLHRSAEATEKIYNELLKQNNQPL